MEVKPEPSSVFDVSKICRACLSDKGEMRSVFLSIDNPGAGRAVAIAEMLMGFSSVQVETNDGLPSLVCLQCFHNINSAFSFKQLCEQSDSNLRQYLGKPLHQKNVTREEETPKHDFPSNLLLDGFGLYSSSGESDDDFKDDFPILDSIPDNANDEKLIAQKQLLKAAKMQKGKISKKLLAKSGGNKAAVDPLLDNPIKMEIVSNENSGSEDILEICTPSPPEIQQNTAELQSQLIQGKSRLKYEDSYRRYENWRVSKNMLGTSENSLLVYFKELSEKYKPTTLWTTWSMLKTTINQNEEIDISEYKKLKAFLKKQSIGYKSPKSKLFSLEEINRFLIEAPDDKYLATKVALIFGVYGGCRRDQLTNIKVEDVERQYDEHIVTIRDTKTNTPRTFAIEGEYSGLVQRYESLRPLNATSDRYFLNYQMGKCTTQVIGKNKFGTMPKQVAEYLKLPDPGSYTGHNFRRATLQPNPRADLKRRGKYKTSIDLDDPEFSPIRKRTKDSISCSISMSATSSNKPEGVEVKLEESEGVEVKLEPEEDFENC